MNTEQARFNMVEQQIRPCEISDPILLETLFAIKRENFVAPQYMEMAFSDVGIPLPGGQKMLLPRITAKLIQGLALKKTDKVLEIATGSGYATAILAKMAEFVYSLEISPENKQFAVHNLTVAGVNNVSVIETNGLHGFTSRAPYDKIFIGGGLKQIPDSIKQQLKIGGILVAIIGEHPVMHGVKVERVNANEYQQTQLFETEIEYLLGANTADFKF